tara:strand:- start:538 stop:897 length:360 start_codon:yes stop_codon:yes gene_type:complete
MASPTQRTLQECRDREWSACVVEKFNHHTNRRIDAFGFGDVLAVSRDRIWLVQATDATSVSKRVAKIKGECAWNAAAWLNAGGGILVWGWKKYKKPVNRRNWRIIEREIKLEDLKGIEA